LVEDALALGVFESDDAVGRVLELVGRLLVRPGRVSDVQPPAIVEAGYDRPIDERRPGDQLDGEALGEGEGVAVELHLIRRGLCRLRDGEGGSDEEGDECEAEHGGTPAAMGLAYPMRLPEASWCRCRGKTSADSAP